MTIKKAQTALDRTLKAANRLLEVNNYVNWPPGTPARQQALYGGVVVLTVGAWQGAVEDLAEASFEVTKKRAKAAKIPLGALAGLVIGKFNTPNKDNTKNLLARAGLELPASWSITSQGTTLNQQQTWEVIDAWLQVRHAVAHGFPFSESDRLLNLLNSCPHVASRVVTGNAPGGSGARVLRFADAQGCIELFSNAAVVLTAAANKHKSTT